MSKERGKLYRATILTLICGGFLIIYLLIRTVWPFPKGLFADKIVEPLTPGLQIDVVEEL